MARPTHRVFFKVSLGSVVLLGGLSGVVLTFSNTTFPLLSQAAGESVRVPGVPPSGATAATSYDWQVPDLRVKQSFASEQPIYFVNFHQEPEEWKKLTKFWNEARE